MPPRSVRYKRGLLVLGPHAPGRVYFIEVIAIQVRSTLSRDSVTNIDLVKSQILVDDGKPLSDRRSTCHERVGSGARGMLPMAV